MEQEKKKQATPVREHQRDRDTTGVTTRVAEPVRASSRLAVPALVALAEALFDMQLDEKHGRNPTQAPTVSVPLAGFQRLIGIVGRCMIPGCDVHLLSGEEGFGQLEGGGIGIGRQVLSHLDVALPIDSALATARSYWSSPHPAAVAVLVYTDGARILLMDGTEIPLG